MSKPARLVNWLIKAGSLAAGGVAFYAIGDELIVSNSAPASSSIGYYLILAMDLVVSFLGSAMLAFLVYFCLWDCCISALFKRPCKSHAPWKNKNRL